jgi:serine phosphatase RsbU (regulator of sigma subunit)
LENQLAKLKCQGFKSILGFDITVQDKKIGTLALLKEVADGFDKETTNIIKTFVSQAEVSVENYRLLNQAIVNERYKEELKIAQKVQSSLLPDQLDANTDFDISAFSIAADEVGGDYYDSFRINKDKVILIIGDVSGKGTSAAFHMSQMKGVFQSLAQLDLTSKDFLAKANTAISNCLEKTSFITTTVFIIDQSTKTIEFSRAGHCPTLYYDSQEKTTTYFTNQGLGLGILRSDDFHQYIEINKQSYLPNDVMVLYTDGITEAQNRKGDEYGYDRLRDTIKAHINETPKTIQHRLIEDMYSFTGTEFIDDDYTTLILKFKEEPESI